MTGNRSVLVLGSTGSVGTQALELISENPEALHGGRARRGRPATSRCSHARSGSTTCAGVAVAYLDVAMTLRRMLPGTGRRGRGALRPRGPRPSSPPPRPADTVLNGITGSVGLGPTLAALGQRCHARAGQQGVAGRGRRARDLGGPKPGQIVPVSTPSTPRSRQGLRGGRAEEVDRRRRPRPAARCGRRREAVEVTVEQGLAILQQYGRTSKCNSNMAARAGGRAVAAGPSREPRLVVDRIPVQEPEDLALPLSSSQPTIRLHFITSFSRRYSGCTPPPPCSGIPPPEERLRLGVGGLLFPRGERVAPAA